MARLTFWGAVETVTGSRFELEIDGQKNLIDCGLFQGAKKNRLRNWDPFTVKPSDIKQILLTHAHIDHSGYLPRLIKQGFTGKIYATHATSELCNIMLYDSAHLQEEDAYWANKKGYSKHKPALPLYTADDVKRTLKLFKPYHYGENFYIADDIRIKFHNAGHILGSSFIDIKRTKGKESRKILFSGDFGRPDRPVLREPDQVYNVDYLIVESTYGNRLHAKSNTMEELERVINESVKRRGVLIVPSFSVGRTQTLLFAIRELEEQKKIPVLPVYIDSPMAIAATEIFEKRIQDFNLTARKLSIEGKKIFRTSNLHICETRNQSISINQVKEKAIIISASGMVTGGRILHHLAARLPEREHTVLFIGHQAEGTRGRDILNNKPFVKIHGREVAVRSKIENISGFSGHGDYEEILAWLMAFNKAPERTFIVHGDSESSEAMAKRIRDYLGWQVTVPKFGESFELNF